LAQATNYFYDKISSGRSIESDNYVRVILYLTGICAEMLRIWHQISAIHNNLI